MTVAASMLPYLNKLKYSFEKNCCDVKISQFVQVESLSTCLAQVVNKFGTTCNKLDGNIRLVTRLS